jgi:hypothetical protein
MRWSEHVAHYYYYYYYYYYYVYVVTGLFLPGASLETADFHLSGFKFQTAVFSALCAMFHVKLSFVVNLLTVFLVWLSDF